MKSKFWCRPARILTPVIDAIQKMITEQTQANVAAAEQEWQRAASRYRAQPVSAAPAVSLRPTSAGIEVHVRYITRAGERHAMKTSLYQALVELLHGRQGESGSRPPARRPRARNLASQNQRFFLLHPSTDLFWSRRAGVSRAGSRAPRQAAATARIPARGTAASFRCAAGQSGFPGAATTWQ